MTLTSTGNAYRLLLPAGTKISLPDDTSAAQARAVAVNEIRSEDRSENAIQLAKPLQLVSPAYIAQRNAAEIHLLVTIDELREEIATLKK